MGYLSWVAVQELRLNYQHMNIQHVVKKIVSSLWQLSLNSLSQQPSKPSGLKLGFSVTVEFRV